MKIYTLTHAAFLNGKNMYNVKYNLIYVQKRGRGGDCI